MPVGSVLEILLISLALGDRYKSILEGAEQAQRSRAETQARLRNELQTRVVIVSDVVHRMNNPLNYVYTGASSVESEIKKLFRVIFGLFPQHDQMDEETRSLKQSIEEKKQKIMSILLNMNTGVEKAAQCVVEIRSLSGIDGIHIERFSVEEIFDAVSQRLIDQLGVSEWERLR